MAHEPAGTPPYKINWMGVINVIGLALTAIATMLGSYAAIRANDSAKNIAALQAINQFNATINMYSRSGACTDLVLLTADDQKLSSLIAKSAFTIRLNENMLDVATRCLGQERHANDNITLSKIDSNKMYQDIFNSFNGYEGILLYWNLQEGNERMICLEVIPSFDRYVRPLLTKIQPLTLSPDAALSAAAKRLIAEYPALSAFLQVTGC